jgi:hypothetical protein
VQNLKTLHGFKKWNCELAFNVFHFQPISFAILKYPAEKPDNKKGLGKLPKPLHEFNFIIGSWRRTHDYRIKRAVFLM